MAKIPISETGSDDAKAEEHVVQIMGPAQGFDGSMPVVKSAPELSQKPSSEQAVSPELSEKQQAADFDGAAPQEEASDVDVLPTTEGEDGSYEKDLDMEQLPEDFKASSEQDEKATAAAVDDILHKDADAALGVLAAPATVMKPSVFERMKNAWFHWWDSPWSRYGTIMVGVLLALVVIFAKPVRNMMLNTAGVRSSVLVSVLDGATSLPLQNAVVKVDGVSGKTNDKGEVRLAGIHLGSHEVDRRKMALAGVKKQVDFGMLIVELSEFTLKPTGQKISFVFTDYLSGKPVSDVSVTSGEATAKSNKDGKAVMTIAPGSTANIKISKDSLRPEEIDIADAQDGVVKRSLVPSARAIFITKETGKFDVYKMHVDGKNRELLLAGTGLETQAMAVLPKPSGDKVAVVSSRDDKRNKDGYLLSGLFVLDTESGDQVNIEYSEQVTLLGWRGDTLVYSQTVAGASAANASRQKIIAYDFAANKRFQLANANYFAGIELIGNTVYYTVSATDPNTKETFSKVNTDGTGKKVLFSGDAWALLRSDYTKLKFQTPSNWYEYTLGASAPVESTPPSSYSSRYFVDSPKLTVSAWVDVRDNAGVLLLRSLSDGKDKSLITQKNMQVPSYWLNDSVIVYRIAGASEVAEYAVNVAGGAPRKIADVSLTSVR
ncbi:hypothetical protein IPL85_01680 [Candidatus Saccharibacteria bacterium]|nr:MAG: hypothetical protein IPL85_01680 [Candidatus Saccharibacteria bacterium]